MSKFVFMRKLINKKSCRRDICKLLMKVSTFHGSVNSYSTNRLSLCSQATNATKKPCYQHIFFDHKSSVIVTLVKITEHNFGLGTLRQGVEC